MSKSQYTPQTIAPRVLIAEDDENACRQLKYLLESSMGLCVSTTLDGRQALTALTSDFYSIFLTDLRMPYLDGLDLIREIQKQHIPVTVIVMTGHASVDGRRAGHASGRV